MTRQQFSIFSLDLHEYDWSSALTDLIKYQIRKKTAAGLLLAVLLTVMLSGCRQETLDIGYIAGLTGPNSDLGISGLYGLHMAVEEINAAGGILGRAVVIREKDDRNSESSALAAVTELHDTGVEFLIGPILSSMMIPLSDYINEQEILTIGPTATSHRLCGKDDFLIRLSPDDSFQARALAEFMIRKGYRTVAVLYDGNNQEYTDSLFKLFQTCLEGLDGRVIHSGIFYSDFFRRYEDSLFPALATDPDALLIIANSFDASNFSQILYKSGSEIPVFHPLWPMTDELLRLGGAAVEGHHLVNMIDFQSQASDFLTFRNRYRETYGQDITFASLLAYESMHILADTMNRTGSTDPRTVRRDIIRTGTFRGLQGPILIDPYGDCWKDMYRYTIRNGQFLRLENEQDA